MDMDTIGRRILRARRSADISQQELASRAGVGVSSVYRWETNKCTPRRRELHAVASALGVDAADLKPPAPEEPEIDAEVLRAAQILTRALLSSKRSAEGGTRYGRRASDALEGAPA